MEDTKTSDIFKNVIDFDLSLMYPPIKRGWVTIRKSKTNTRRERRLLRHASQKFNMKITSITNFHDGTVTYRYKKQP